MMIKSHLCSLPRRFFAHGHHKVVCASWTTTTGNQASSNNRLVLPAIRCFTIKKTGQEHHAFFQEQLQELENERKSFFGDNDDASTSLMSDPISGMSMPKTGKDHHAMFEKQLQELETERASVLGTSSFTQQQKQKEKPENEPPSPEQIEFLHDEREAIFQFSEQEKQAWGRSGPLNTISSDLMQEIEQARQQQGMELKGQQQDTIKTSSDSYGEHHPSFSHVTQDGGSVHMVDVGQKAVTARMAQAQTKVLLPDEVLKAFAATSGELIGPKGPIFATAKLAGIMAAKKTSELIPLCHPLPLDQVKIDIRLQGTEVIIDCTCRVTHKTGVEMEALTGSTVAALTVYDMVKAVSHQVQITNTKLIAKTGGNRTVSNDP